jgi:glycosyltransferase involved in cell wall biosynthesis
MTSQGKETVGSVNVSTVAHKQPQDDLLRSAAPRSGQAADRRSPAIDISVVVPARNEEGTIAEVITRSFRSIADLGRVGEVLVVNDGSTDRTGEILAQLAKEYPRLRVFTNRRSLGMTAALQKMFTASHGQIVILIPGDMESDPLKDIPVLVKHMEAEDLDVVAGWRQGRRDAKIFASTIYNFVMRHLAGVRVHDGNWIKAMRREVIENFPPLRSDWHRFLLMIAAYQGFRIGEVKTFYQPRPSGSSKFGVGRIPVSFLDVLVVKFLLMFSRSPMRFFGGLGLLGMVISLTTFLYLTGLYVIIGKQQRPIFIAAGTLAIISVVLLLVGFLAELIVSQGERITELERRLGEQNDDLQDP